ncbi:MAG TPA: T9SS type A sorting domain-containing protein, partial [Chitinophagales bacterium]|nr:T9SS type A sorting domain-containing protein [Chitinophagales bacterium]
IKYFTERETPVTIQLYDLFGRLISSENLMFYNGNNEVKINTNQLTNAMYICTVSSENFREVKKIIVNSK